MSTSLSHSGLQPTWKEEVNRRIEAHKNRRGISVVDESKPTEGEHSASSRAAAAAARVAARYAKAPSFSEMQAAEVRAALREAEAATRVALEAQAAAQLALDQFETRSANAEEAAPTETRSADVRHENAYSGGESSGTSAREMQIRWEPDMPVRQAYREIRVAVAKPEPEDSFTETQDFEAVEAQSIAANLIEFPREIVAPRRMRPRITEALVDSDEPQQLSIFEVDPDSVSTEPMGTVAYTAPEPTWIGSSWQQIELDDQPESRPDYYAIPADDAPRLYQAPFSRRMMATMVDTALILAVVLGIAFLIASRFDTLPGKHVTEALAGLAVLGIAALYEWFFLTFAKVTPGMRYAQLSLCTFEEEIPTAAQIKGRMKAMLISVLPMGLGMLWSIFDEDQMSWHDRLSKTYLRLS